MSFPFWLLALTLLSTGIYSWLIFQFFIDFPSPNQEPNNQTNLIHTELSIVVPFKNEEARLSTLLQALKDQNTPCKILLVDDHSTDRSLELALKTIDKLHLRAEVIKNNGRGKKHALLTAANYTESKYLLLTDADCKPNPFWVTSVATFLDQHQPGLLILPVTTEKAFTFSGKLQELDFLSLIASTFGSPASPFLCNAANLCINRETFLKLEPFKSNLHIPTGDDIFILQTFKTDNQQSITVLADQQFWVKTQVKSDWKGFFEQRLRWGSKTVNYSDPRALLIATIVLIQCTLLFVALLLAGFKLFSLTPFLILFGIKFAVDSLLLIKAARFFQKQYLIPLFLFAELLQIIYVPPIAFLGFVRNVFYYRK